MFIGKVVGTVVATPKLSALTGAKLLLISPGPPVPALGERVVAVDILGAGVGETVIVATGQAARLALTQSETAAGFPVDASVVGILERLTRKFQNGLKQ
jgi:ethanolamine utilization protein EutN